VARDPHVALPSPGARHDWAFILGSPRPLDAAGGMAAWIRGAGALFVLAGLAARVGGGLVCPPRDHAVPVIP
jgi:hypothetical protein